MYRRLNILTSFAYVGDDAKFADLLGAVGPYTNVMIDSGAFTNYSIRLKRAAGGKPTGKPILLDDYIAFLRRFGDRVFSYIALDVIRDPDGTRQNLKAMIDAGLRPMPVFVEGCSVDELAGMLEINDRLCVAGAIGCSDVYIRNRYKQVYQLSGGRAKIHGLGYGRWPGIFHADLASCDSSTFIVGTQRYGVIATYGRERGFQKDQWHMLVKGNPENPARRAEIIAYLAQKFDLRADELHNPDLYHSKDALIALPRLSGSYAYLDFTEHVRDFGKLYFLALNAQSDIFSLVAVAAAAGMGDTSLKNIRDLYYSQTAQKPGNFYVTNDLLRDYTEWQ